MATEATKRFIEIIAKKEASVFINELYKSGKHTDDELDNIYGLYTKVVSKIMLKDTNNLDKFFENKNSINDFDSFEKLINGMVSE